MDRKILLGLLGLIVTPFFFALPVGAVGTRITAELGYGGYTVPGRWMPLRIKLDHPVNRGRIEVTRRNQAGNIALCETFPANIPRIECPVLINEELTGISIRIKSGTQILGENRLDLDGRQFPGHLFLTVNVPAKIQHALEGMLQPQEPVLAVPVGIPELPFSTLGYDGVSGIVMADPGPVLKPAQVSAFKAWISGGGRAVIYGTPPNSESIVRLLKIRQNPEKSIMKKVAVGFGKLVLIPGNSRDDLIGAPPSGWQKLIELPPYRHSTRLSLNRCFPQQEFKPRPVDLRVDLMAVLGLWMAVLLAILSFTKRKLINISLFSVLMIALAVPLAYQLAGKWHRGYDIRCLAVNLPKSAGTLIKGEAAAGENSFWNLKSSPWGAEIGFGPVETGALKTNFGSPPEWRHLESQVFSTLLRNTSQTCYFIGWLPGGMFSPEFLKGSAAQQEIFIYRPTGEIYRIPGRQYQTWMDFLNGHFRSESTPEKDPVPISQAPLWLKESGDWLKRLSTAAPAETLWVIGRRATGGDFLQIQHSNRIEFIWVSPLANVSI